MATPEQIEGQLTQAANQFFTADMDIQGGSLNNPDSLAYQLRTEEHTAESRKGLIFQNVPNSQNITQTLGRFPTQLQVDGSAGAARINVKAHTRGDINGIDESIDGHTIFVAGDENTVVNTQIISTLGAESGTHAIQTYLSGTPLAHNHEGSAAKENLFIRAATVNSTFTEGGDKFIQPLEGTTSLNVNYSRGGIDDVLNIRTVSGLTSNIIISGDGAAFVETGEGTDHVDTQNFKGDENDSSVDVLVSASTGTDTVIGADGTYEAYDFRDGVKEEVANIRVTLQNAEAFNNNNPFPDGDFVVEYLDASGQAIEQETIAEKFNGILHDDQNLPTELLRRAGGSVTFANPNSASVPNTLRSPNSESVEDLAKSLAQSGMSDANDDVPVATPLEVSTELAKDAIITK